MYEAHLHMFAVSPCPSRFPMAAVALISWPSYNIKYDRWFRAALAAMVLLQKWRRGG